MNQGALARMVHMFGTGVVDQILLSGTNFLVGFAMIRFTSDVNYGQFVMVQSAVLLLISAQGALIGPITAIAPQKPPDVRRAMLGAVESTQVRFLRRLALVAMAIPIAGYLIGAWRGTVALVAGGAVLAGWAALLQAYRRSALIISSRPQSMLRADVIYAVVLLTGIAIAVFLTKFPAVVAVLALTVAAWVGGTIAHRSFARDPGWVPGDFGPFWREVKPLAMWSAAGAVIYWLFAQSFNYVLPIRLGFTAVTNVNAARLVMMPVIVFSLGINNLLMPVAGRWLAEVGLRRAVRRLAGLTVCILALDFMYFALAWIFRGWLIGDLLHKIIADRDRLLILWACISVIFFLREVIQAILYALRRIKSLFWLTALAAAVSLPVMWFGVVWWGAASVLVGQLTGECAYLIGLVILLRQQLRAQQTPIGT